MNHGSPQGKIGSPSSSPPKSSSDLQLIQRTLAGDPAALEAFSDRMLCVPRILYVRNRRSGRPLGDSEMDDLAQDVVAKVWKKLDQFDGRAALETWVYRFCYLEFLYFLRSRRNRLNQVPIYDGELANNLASPNPSSAEADQHAALHEALDRAEPQDARVLRLKHFEELTFDGIGQLLGISPNTVKTRYYRAISRVRALLSYSQSGDRQGNQG